MPIMPYTSTCPVPQAIQLVAPLARTLAAELAAVLTQPGAAPAPAAAREQLLSFLALNAHFTAADIADLRELLSTFPAAAVYDALQRAYRQRQQSQPDAAGKAREAQLSRVLLSPLYQLAYLSHLKAATA
jgi:hypothetical protein